MGPRCSSAETQVCHRSYIIAASFYAVINLKIVKFYKPFCKSSLFLSWLLYKNIKGKMRIDVPISSYTTYKSAMQHKSAYNLSSFRWKFLDTIFCNLNVFFFSFYKIYLFTLFVNHYLFVYPCSPRGGGSRIWTY